MTETIDIGEILGVLAISYVVCFVGAALISLVVWRYFGGRVRNRILPCLIIGFIPSVIMLVQGGLYDATFFGPNDYLSASSFPLPVSWLLDGAFYAAIFWMVSSQLLQASPKVSESQEQKIQSVSNAYEHESYSVFLSYRRADSQDICGRIYEYLDRELGHGVVFKDVDSLKLGVNFKDELARTLEHCKVALIVMGPNWIGTENGSEARIASERDYVRIEAEAVLGRDIPVIPVFVRGARAVDVGKLPETLVELDERNGIQVRPDPDFKNDMNRLVTALKKILA